MKRIFLFTFILFISFFETHSQVVPGKQVYSLRECLDIASKSSPDIKLAYSQVGLATADLTSAFGDFLPSLRLNGGYTRQLNNESGQSVNVQGSTVLLNSYNMSALASINIFNGFQREKNYSRAQDALNATFHNIKYIQQKVSINIYRLFVETSRNSQIVKLRKDNLELGKKNLEKIKAQFEAGTIPITNVYSQEADLGDRELQVVKAENDLNISKSNLLTAMGMQPDYSVEFQESSLPLEISSLEIKKFLAETGSFDSNVQQALNTREDYQASNLQISAARTSLSMSNANYYPSLGASGGWSWSNSDLSDFSKLGRSYIGLNLSVPIFENFKTNYQVESARLQLQQAEIQQYQLEQSIRGALKTAYLNLEAAEKQIEISNRSLLAAEKNFEAVQESMKVGKVSNSDYFLSNNMLINSQINKITAVYNYYQAQKEVLFSIGKLTNL